jgi:hypothetical protein
MSNSETSAFSPNDAQLRAFWIIFAPVLRRAGGSGPEFGMRFSAVHAARRAMWLFLWSNLRVLGRVIIVLSPLQGDPFRLDGSQG